jgi:type II secretory pathway pseudopilin PulG
MSPGEKKFEMCQTRSMRMKDQSGITIVELIITIVAFGFIASGIATLMLNVIGVQRQASNLQVATRAAQTEVESLRNDNYDSLTDGQNVDFTTSLPGTLPAPKTGSVAITEPTAGIKRVDVTVSYTDDGRTRNVELSSLIGVIGISQ